MDVRRWPPRRWLDPCSVISVISFLHHPGSGWPRQVVPRAHVESHFMIQRQRRYLPAPLGKRYPHSPTLTHTYTRPLHHRRPRWQEEVVRGLLVPERGLFPIAPPFGVNDVQILLANVVRVQDQPAHRAELLVPVHTKNGVCKLIPTCERHQSCEVSVFEKDLHLPSRNQEAGSAPIMTGVPSVLKCAASSRAVPGMSPPGMPARKRPLASNSPWGA